MNLLDVVGSQPLQGRLEVAAAPEAAAGSLTAAPGVALVGCCFLQKLLYMLPSQSQPPDGQFA